jgi:hypothetical protein
MIAEVGFSLPSAHSSYRLEHGPSFFYCNQADGFHESYRFERILACSTSDVLKTSIVAIFKQRVS